MDMTYPIGRIVDSDMQISVTPFIFHSRKVNFSNYDCPVRRKGRPDLNSKHVQLDEAGHDGSTTHQN